MITQKFNTGRLVTTTTTTTKQTNHPAPATAVENYIGPMTVPFVQKMPKLR